MTNGDPPRPLGGGTAPGKVILLGEHAVVYGQPALAVPVTAVEARATVWAGPGPFHIQAHLPQREGGTGRAVRLEDAEDGLATAARAALARLGLAASPPAWTVDLASTVPTGRGMGSSAATSVALVRALGRAAGAPFPDAEASALALDAERVTHGNPSGIDNTVVALGRPLRFCRGEAQPLRLAAPVTLLIADSGEPSLTRDMVAGVRARREARPEVYEGWFGRIGKLADEAATALAQGELSRLGRLLDGNHLVLQAMRVSTPRLDQLVAAARLSGALGAKLSGAGGGGVVLALVTRETAPAVAEALVAAGAAQVLRTVLETGG